MVIYSYLILILFTCSILVKTYFEVNFLSKDSVDVIKSEYAFSSDCIFVVNEVNEKRIELMSNFLNNVTITFCKSSYVLLPAIGDVKSDLNKKNIKIIRYSYPNPIEYAILMPMYIEVEECALFNIKMCDLIKLKNDLLIFFNSINNKKYLSTDTIDAYILTTMHIRYACLYRSPSHFRKNLNLILKDTYSFSIYYKHFPIDKNISYNTCVQSNNNNNNELGIIQRLRRRGKNMNMLMKSYFEYEHFTTLILAQNEQFFDFRWVKDKITSNNNITIYLFWCSNWNSVFYLFRLLPLLLSTEFTLILDDDFTLKPEFIKLGKYFNRKYNTIISPLGWQPYDRKWIKVNNMKYLLQLSNTIYSGQIIKSEWFSHVYRFKIPYKLWGDEVSTAWSCKTVCGIKLAYINRNLKYLSQENSYGITNRKNYRKGPKLIYPFMESCSNFTKNKQIIPKCFFKIPN